MSPWEITFLNFNFGVDVIMDELCLKKEKSNVIFGVIGMYTIVDGGIRLMATSAKL